MGVCGSNEQESHIDEIFASRAEAATVATQCKEVEVIFNRLNEVMWNEFDPANKGRAPRTIPDNQTIYSRTPLPE